ncbi:MAG: MBL fold metallo-hydrolase [Eggerthella lenta]
MEEKNLRVQRGSDRARTENRSGGARAGERKRPARTETRTARATRRPARTARAARAQAPAAVEGGEGGQRAASNRGDQSARRNFASPKKDPNATLKIIPLGGLDAIGKNMTVFECKGDMILDDAGLMFPDDNHPGVDLILPDYTYVLENADKLRGIVITHGHEDHTGTLPYLMKVRSQRAHLRHEDDA